jgi:hypothetical protein
MSKNTVLQLDQVLFNKSALRREIKHYQYLIKNEKCIDYEKAHRYWRQCIKRAEEKLRYIDTWEWKNKIICI